MFIICVICVTCLVFVNIHKQSGICKTNDEVRSFRNKVVSSSVAFFFKDLNQTLNYLVPN